MIRRSFLTCVLALAFTLTGCGSGNEPAKPAPAAGSAPAPAGTPADTKFTIAVIPKGTTHEFWKSIHAGALKAAKEFNVEIIWKGPVKEDDREQQIQVVESMVVRKVSGIVLAPLDDSALVTPVEDAIAKNVPVVIIDSDLKSDKYTSFVATDNYKGGVMGAAHLAELLGDKGKVIMLRYQEGSASTMNREQGFLDEIKKHPGIEVVSADQRSGATVEGAYQKAEQLLSKFKSADGGLSVDGIFTPNEPTAFGMMKALEDSNLVGKVKHVGFDASPKLVEGLKAGHIDALVVQNPVNMGYEGVKTMVLALTKKEVPKRVDTGLKLVTAKNMDSPEIKDVISPDLEKWLNGQ